jgi:hypothetical protein
MSNILVAALAHRQSLESLSDGQLAKKLGIHRSTWGYIKSGKRDVGLDFVKKAVGAFPDLWPVVTSYLTQPETHDSSIQPHGRATEVREQRVIKRPR